MVCLRVLIPVTALAVLWLLSRPLAVSANPETTDRARAFVKDHEIRLHALDTAANLAWWNANTTGKDEDFERKAKAQNRIDEALSDPKRFAELKDLKEHRKDIDDPITARAIDVLYLLYLEKQVDPRPAQEDHRQVQRRREGVQRPSGQGGRQGNDRQRSARAVLKNSKDSARRKEVWEASKAVGGVVEADLKELVKLRNQAAIQLGFKNYHALQLYLNEQNGDDLLKLFDELDDLTRAPFAAAKAEIDQKLAAELQDQARRADALALPRSVLPGNAGRLRGRPRRPLCQGRHRDLPRQFLRRHRPADRSRHRPQRPLREDRARARTPSAPTSTAKATCACWPTSCPTNTGPRRCCTSSATRSTARTTTIPAVAAVLPAHGVAHSDHRRRGHDVRAHDQARGVPGEDGRRGREPQGVRRDRRQDAANIGC